MKRALFVKTVVVSSARSLVAQLKGLLRGQWVLVNGMKARVVNFACGRVVLWMQKDKMCAVFP